MTLARVVTYHFQRDGSLVHAQVDTVEHKRLAFYLTTLEMSMPHFDEAHHALVFVGTSPPLLLRTKDD